MCTLAVHTQYNRKTVVIANLIISSAKMTSTGGRNIKNNRPIMVSEKADSILPSGTSLTGRITALQLNDELPINKVVQQLVHYVRLF